MRFAVLLLASILAIPLLSAQRTVPSGGQWLIEPGDHPGTVQLSVRYGERGNSSNWSRDVALREFVGLSAADMRDRESRCISRSCGPEGSRTSPRVLKCRDGPALLREEPAETPVAAVPQGRARCSAMDRERAARAR